MPVYEKGPVHIHYQEAGSGFPLLLIPGGGLNSTLSFFATTAPFNAIEEFKREYRCIAMDLRNANGGQSSGPVETERPWDAYADDQLGLMDHLGIDKFLVMGFCIGGPFIWNLLRRAPDRIVAAVLAQPSGFRPEVPDLFYQNNIKAWGPPLCARRPDVTMTMIDAFLSTMYRANADFVFTVTRDFVRACQTPILVLPDDIPAHPYAVAMESALLAPNAQASLFPWKEPRERVPLAVRHIRTFLRAHRPATATG
ncbi:MAG: alpha/beta fold hydrolase [Hyphomicrobiaceae bacterium]